MNATRLWLIWQAMLLPMAFGMSRRGKQRFVEWATGLALNVEEHTITQSLICLNRPQDWRNLETFAEYGSFNQRYVQMGMAEQVDAVFFRLWFDYHVWAGDDTKVHRNSPDVWGTCTFHEYSARCPNRASTVRAHNWVVTGALMPMPDQPALCLPIAGQLYFRKKQLPAPQKGPPIVFRTKCELLVEQMRRHANSCSGKHLAIFDGGFALASVVQPLVKPEDPTQPRMAIITRLRQDARLFALPPAERPKGKGGPTPLWGKRLAPPRQGGRWPGGWKQDKALIYRRVRQVRYKEVLCLWKVLGHDVVVKAVVAEVEGYKKRFTLVSSAKELSGAQIVELFAARFRQEDAFRDLKQRLGWEECRAWTRNPIERTTQMLFVTMTALRMLQVKLQEEAGDDWWLHTPWNRRKTRPSLLDVERLLWQHRAGIQQCLTNWLESEGNATEERTRQAAM
jgi:Transposase DDE domain